MSLNIFQKFTEFKKRSCLPFIMSFIWSPMISFFFGGGGSECYIIEDTFIKIFNAIYSSSSWTPPRSSLSLYPPNFMFCLSPQKQKQSKRIRQKYQNGNSVSNPNQEVICSCYLLARASAGLPSAARVSVSSHVYQSSCTWMALLPWSQPFPTTPAIFLSPLL